MIKSPCCFLLWIRSPMSLPTHMQAHTCMHMHALGYMQMCVHTHTHARTRIHAHTPSSAPCLCCCFTSHYEPSVGFRLSGENNHNSIIFKATAHCSIQNCFLHSGSFSSSPQQGLLCSQDPFEGASGITGSPFLRCLAGCLASQDVQ